MTDTARCIDVSVIGPFAWLPTEGDSTRSVFTAPEANVAGVYLVAIETPNGWLIHSVGQTSCSVDERFRQHTREFLAGTYSVYDVDALREGRLHERWRGLWKGKDAVQRYDKYLERAGEIAPYTRMLLRALRIYVLPIEADKRLLHRLEAAIVKALRDAPRAQDVIEDGYRLSSRWDDEKPVIVERLDGPEFVGLPRRIGI